MPVLTSSWAVHGAGKTVVRVQEDQELGAFESRPDRLESGIVKALGEASGAEDDTADVGQNGEALDFGCDAGGRRGKGKGRESVKAVLTC